MFAWYDYAIIILPVLFVLYMGWYVRRYIKSVSDFLSASRLCGRYIINIGNVAWALSIIGLISYAEVHYKTGFALSFWNGILMPMSIFISLSGFCTYRFRQTKAMSIGQFLEMRYSRKFRIFAATLRSASEMLTNMIMPALAARFFITFLGLPQYVTIFGCKISMFLIICIISMTLAVSIIVMGGMLSILITDALQGFLLYPLLVTFVIFLLCKFSWNGEIVQVMMDRAPGESFINPYDLHKLKDFNFLMFGVSIMTVFMHTASWFTGNQSAAKNAHEQKMAGLLGSWRSSIDTLFYIIVTIGIITILNHKDWAPQAKVIRNALVEQVVLNLELPNEQIRKDIIENAAKIPEHNQTYGVSKPLSDAANLDTPYVDAARQVLTRKVPVMENGVPKLDADGKPIEQYELVNGSGLTQEFKTLYHQLMLGVTMRHLLPHGMLGLFCLLMILAMISTDDSRIWSAASTIAQDCILPFLKKPLTPNQHMNMIRWIAIGIGVFFCCGSWFMSQLDYVSLFVTIMTSLWQGGCGPVLLFGFYSTFGTTAGAWASLGSGMVLALGGIILQRNWANFFYPFFEARGWVDGLDHFLRTISKPFNPIVVWEMNKEKCPFNSYEIYLVTMIITLLLYLIVSKLTLKEPFNLDRMLHRGKYAEDDSVNLKTKWTLRTVFSKLVGITPEYTLGDKFIAWGMFFYSFILQFGTIFLATMIWNCFSRWPITWWGNYYFTTLLVIPATVASFTAVWFGIGGVRDMIRLFKDLEARVVNHLDDGRVEGHISVVDIERMKKIDEQEENKKDALQK